MRIEHVLNEAKFSKPIYAYHATLSENLKSILKHGLIPNKREGGYGSDEQSSFGYELTPLSGVYFTKSPKDALYIANSLDDDTIIVICKVQPKQLELDEDRLVADVLKEKTLLVAISTMLKKFDYTVEDIPEREIEELIKRAILNMENYLESQYNFNDKKIANIHEDLSEYITELVNYLLAQESGEFRDSSDIKRLQNSLTKKLRHIASTFTTFKIDTNITYSGANKIVGFYYPIGTVGYGDLGELSGWANHVYPSTKQFIAALERSKQRS